MDLQRLFTIALSTLVGGASRFGDDAIQPARVSWSHEAPRCSPFEQS
jgi:hypothetical protein